MKMIACLLEWVKEKRDEKEKKKKRGNYLNWHALS